jgi:hypothetical protein
VPFESRNRPIKSFPPVDRVPPFRMVRIPSSEAPMSITLENALSASITVRFGLTLSMRTLLTASGTVPPTQLPPVNQSSDCEPSHSTCAAATAADAARADVPHPARRSAKPGPSPRAA